MTKELWHYMILRLIASNPNVCVADLYWDRVLDQGGNPNMGIISLIVCLVSDVTYHYIFLSLTYLLLLLKFYEYCQKALDRNLNRTGDAAVIKLYHRIARLHGPPLMEIQEVGRDLGYIRYAFNSQFLRSIQFSNLRQRHQCLWCRQRWKAQENEYRSPQQNL
jgi:hypothetical protein